MTLANSDTDPSDDAFDAVHRALCALGWCDATGCAEYRRVKREWIACGRPPEIHAFIRIRSNTNSFATPPWRPGPGAWKLVLWRGADGLIHHASHNDRCFCRWDLMQPGHAEPPTSTPTCLACIVLSDGDA